MMFTRRLPRTFALSSSMIVGIGALAKDPWLPASDSECDGYSQELAEAMESFDKDCRKNLCYWTIDNVIGYNCIFGDTSESLDDCINNAKVWHNCWLGKKEGTFLSKSDDEKPKADDEAAFYSKYWDFQTEYKHFCDSHGESYSDYIKAHPEMLLIVASPIALVGTAISAASKKWTLGSFSKMREFHERYLVFCSQYKAFGYKLTIEPLSLPERTSPIDNVAKDILGIPPWVFKVGMVAAIGIAGFAAYEIFVAPYLMALQPRR